MILIIMRIWSFVIYVRISNVEIMTKKQRRGERKAVRFIKKIETSQFSSFTFYISPQTAFVMLTSTGNNKRTFKCPNG